jgi:Tfp pilus assembly protein PilV
VARLTAQCGRPRGANPTVRRVSAAHSGRTAALGVTYNKTGRKRPKREAYWKKMRRSSTLGYGGKTLLARLRSSGGFGLIELLVAMVVMMIAVLALVAALSSSHVSVVRASRISTAAAVASAELETFRAVKYTDAAFTVGTTTANKQGADGRMYPTTTTVADVCSDGSVPTGTPLACSGDGRPLKSVTVIVRDPTTTTRVLVRESSAFDEATGQ